MALTDEEKATIMGPRRSITRSEILRILTEKLPEYIAFQNEREGLALPSPSTYMAARVKVPDDVKFPFVMVGVSMSFRMVVPRVHFADLTGMIYVITGRLSEREQVDDQDDIGDLAQRVMSYYSASHCLPDGRKIWSHCIAGNVSQLPALYEQEWSGCSIELQIAQMGVDLWTPATT
jgi:hypothetical protein